MDDRSANPRADLEPDEVALDRLLAAAPREALPLGFRDGVLARISAERSRSWEWIVAAALALPSLAYVAWAVGTDGAGFIAALGDLVLAAQSADTEAPSVVIDGLIVLAVAFVGLASIVAEHALFASRPARMQASR